MSKLLLELRASDGVVRRWVEPWYADCVVASLAADPETLEDVELALGRHLASECSSRKLDAWREAQPGERNKKRLVLMDLVGRVMASGRGYELPGYRGAVPWFDRQGMTEQLFPFHLASDWMILNQLSDFESQAPQRRADRERAIDRHVREVIYGRVVEFIVREVWSQSEGLADLDRKGRHGLIRDVHVRWLMTVREDLQGHSPREWMIDDRHEHIEADLSDQERRWSFLRAAPPGISRQSAAYLNAGFGIHEIVMYYEMVRYLLQTAVDRAAEHANGHKDLADEIRHLDQLRQEWLHTPYYDDMPDRSPARIIDQERRRLPEVVTASQAVVDEDCPLCQMMADESFGPTFWHLDGCEMDDDFAFSFCRDRDEWQLERWYDDEELDDDKDSSSAAPQSENGEGADENSFPSLGADQVWHSNFLNRELVDQWPPGPAIYTLLFGIGGCLAELLEDLKTLGRDDELDQQLRGRFDELRRSLSESNAWQVESVVACFSEDLGRLADTHLELTEKCADLDQQLNDVLRRYRQMTAQQDER